MIAASEWNRFCGHSFKMSPSSVPLGEVEQLGTKRQRLSVSDKLARGLHIFKMCLVCVFDLPLGKCRGSLSATNTRPGWRHTLSATEKISRWVLVGGREGIEGVCVFVCQPKMSFVRVEWVFWSSSSAPIHHE